MPLRHKDTKFSQRFKYHHYTLSEVFEPLCLCGKRRLFGVDSKFKFVANEDGINKTGYFGIA